jgi:transposase
VQEVTGDSVEVEFVDQGYMGDRPAQDAAVHGLQLEVVKLLEAKRGFVLLPRRGVVERGFAWTARFRRLSKEYEYLPESSETMIYLAMSRLMLRRLALQAPYGVPSPQRQGLGDLAWAF